MNLINDKENIYDVSPKIVESDLYDFIKNDLHLATYMFKSNKENITRDSQIGFIAQDIEHTKLGQYIVVGDSSKGDNLMVHQNNYINTIAGALKNKAIDKIETLEIEINNLKKWRKSIMELDYKKLHETTVRELIQKTEQSLMYENFSYAIR